MKAFISKLNGGSDNLYLTDVPIPAIGPREVLIETKAISINPVDAFLRKNEQVWPIFLRPAHDQNEFILGWDVSGIVTEVGSQVNEFKKGDNVFGLVNYKGQGKTYAEYVAAPAEQLALKPDLITHEEAAAACLAGLTAWQSLITYAKLKEGDKVVIHAAAGGVGHYAVQIAKAFKAAVVAVVSTDKTAFARELGADEVIDYTRENFEEMISDADIAIDPIRGDHLYKSVKLLKEGGRLISLQNHFNEEPLASIVKEKQLLTHRLDVTSNGKDLKALAELLGAGKVRTHIAGRYNFSNLRKAHHQIETGKTAGKIVVIT
jgi:NADPH:quinone reductase-like Zn-dependent oxidoreductase